MGNCNLCSKSQSPQEVKANVILESVTDDMVISKTFAISESHSNPLDKYSIEGYLGQGSFGKVYLVIHKETNYKRAMKEVGKNFAISDKEILNEIDILKKLDHPHIVRIFEFFIYDDKYFIITEFCEGGELFSLINRKIVFSEEDILSIAYQVLHSIYYCHLNNVVHRDLKPENLLIAKKGDLKNIQIKVIDFGTARIFQENENSKKFVGSAYYIAPEVINQKSNEKCDLWSLGVIIYILFFGVPPFNGKNDSLIFKNILSQPLSFNPKLVKKISKDSKNLIEKLLVKDPLKRPSAEEALKHKVFDRFKIQLLSKEKLMSILSKLRNFKIINKLQLAALKIIVHNIPSQFTIDLELAFRTINKSNDSRIHKNELIQAFIDNLNFTENEAETEVNRIFDSIDVDKNNFLDYEEFFTACYEKEQLLNDEYLKFAFKFFDTDDSGQITVQELNEAFFKDQNAKEGAFETIIKQIDKNGDKEISFEEFKEMMRKIII